jgi:hypothetical protein
MTDYAGTRLRAMFASDLGHWDVPDACAVLPEAWELVERGHVAVDDFKAFTHRCGHTEARSDHSEWLHRSIGQVRP